MAHAPLDVDSAVPYLLRHGLVDVVSIVDGDLRVADSARRNRNLQVVSEHGRSYLLKQPDAGELHARQTIAFEAEFYATCYDDDRAAPVRPFLPRYVTYLSGDGILVLELVRECVPLWQHL